MGNIAKYIELWENYLLNERRYSPHTAKSYLADLLSFLGFISDHLGEEIKIVSTLEELKVADFRSWLAWRRQQHCEASSTKRALSSVRQFFAYLRSFHQLDNQAILAIKAPKLAEKLPLVLSVEQIQELRAALSSLNNNNAKYNWVCERDLALIMLLYGTGMRIREALSITYKAWTESNNYLAIIGKGRKTRLVPLMPQVKEQVAVYINACTAAFNNESPLFIGCRGGQLSPRVFYGNLSKLQVQLGWLEHFSAHNFRHSYATHLLAASNQIRPIQELLGHASLSSTQRYTKVNLKQLEEVYASCHPLAKK